MVEQNNNPKSVFNEAVMGIQRLGASWSSCNSYSRRGDLAKWREELRVIWRELIKYTNQIDQGEITRKKVSLLDGAINKAGLLGKRVALYKLLEKKEMLLRSLQEEAGKGDVYRDDGLDDIEI